jgi:hypothetical protein
MRLYRFLLLLVDVYLNVLSLFFFSGAGHFSRRDDGLRYGLNIITGLKNLLSESGNVNVVALNFLCLTMNIWCQCGSLKLPLLYSEHGFLCLEISHTFLISLIIH